jgi:hypothetical protein
MLKGIGLRMLSLDEGQNVRTGPVHKQRQLLNGLTYLGHALPSPLVGRGTKEALRAVPGAPQLANRCEPAALPRWQLTQECPRLLASFARVLPRRQPSRLADAQLARKRWARSAGSRGELSVLLPSAAVYAVQSGAERLAAPGRVAIAGVPPSERRRRAERLVGRGLVGALMAAALAALGRCTAVLLVRAFEPGVRDGSGSLVCQGLAPLRLLESRS